MQERNFITKLRRERERQFEAERDGYLEFFFSI
jgi:hypothetical protein